MTAIPEEAADAVRQVVADAYARQTREIRWADVSHVALAAAEQAAPLIAAAALRGAADTITALAAALSHATDRSEGGPDDRPRS